jgi:hypothetical protein
MIQHRATPITSFWRFFAPAVLGLVLSAGVAEAQRRPNQGRAEKAQAEQSRRDQTVPKGFGPPAGMCRIWISGVPASQQPAPTDCASAVRNRPANGKVLFGEDPSKANKGKSRKSSSTADGLLDLLTRRKSK